MKNKKSIRLPNHITPISYNLTIKPDLESFTFSGNEIIKIKIKEEIKKITLHCKDIDIETAKISSPDQSRGPDMGQGKKKTEQFAHKITYDIKKETATFFFKNKIKGNYGLHLSFIGIINDNLRGLYRSKYILDSKEKYIATTQFEATDARRAFPCFDEPSNKATFKVSLIIKDNHTAISNTLPVKIEKHSAGFKVVSFSPTPKMSTYLLAFIVGEFEYIEGYTNNIRSNNKSNRTHVRVFTTAGKKEQAKFALEVAIKSLEFYNQYFDIDYPMPNLDLIALPDFSAGAMENWGAVTFRETALLVDEKHSSLINKQWVALVIAHELAHQWFGNLVTMKWWTDLWLNEGFATYVEYLAIDKIFPKWNIWSQFLTADHNVALSLDSLVNSHPIEIEVHHPNEISEIFDKISYSKGASIIRMLSSYIGQDNFRDGLRHYLKKHSYKNTDTIDLWKSFEKVSQKNISKMMSSWTKETGYPLVSLEQNNNQYYLNQERFFSNRVESNKYKKSKNNKHLWPTPIKYQDKNGIKQVFLKEKSIPITTTLIDKINKDEESFIRVRYDDISLKHLSEKILNQTLSVADRLGLIRDLFALAEGGYIKTDLVLQFTNYYKNETEYIVWVEIASGINRIYNLIYKENFVKKYEKYARDIFSPLMNKLGFEKKKNEKYFTPFLRSLIISQSALYKDKKTINTALSLFKNRNKYPIDADLRGAIYRIVALNKGEKELKLFEKLYKKEIHQEEKSRLGYAITSFKEISMFKKILSFIESSDVKSQDAPFLFASLWQNKDARGITWQYIKNNWPTIVEKYDQGGFLLSKLLSPLAEHTKMKDLKDAKIFFEKNLAPGAERTLLQAYEKIESNALWLKADRKNIEKWLKKI